MVSEKNACTGLKCVLRRVPVFGIEKAPPDRRGIKKTAPHGGGCLFSRQSVYDYGQRNLSYIFDFQTQIIIFVAQSSVFLF